jgi:uncharacterized damage-inducible protein DinB
MRVLPLAVLALALPFVAAPAALAKQPQNAAAAAQSVPKTPPKAVGFRAEFLVNLDETQEKILELADSIPAEKYTWRPTAEVRSVSEVFMHIAGGNYFLSTFIGAEPPKMTIDLEKDVTRKGDVIAELKRSFEHLRTAANSVRDFEKPVKMFGNQTTARGVLVTILSHLHEHLGQSITYARMNGVVPPWSR